MKYQIIEGNVKIGKNTKVWEFVKIFGDVEIGDNCLVSSFSEIKGNQGKVIIGNSTRIQKGFYIAGPAIIGAETFIGVHVVIGNDKYPPSEYMTQTTIGKNCIIGNGVVIVPGIKIGDKAVIGAGTVVTKEIPPGKFVLGNPGKIIGTRKEYEEKKRRYEMEGLSRNE